MADQKPLYQNRILSQYWTRAEYEYDVIYHTTQFLPGKYDLENNGIEIIDEGIISLLPEGGLQIEIDSDAYYCRERWIRFSPEHEELRSFVLKEIN